MSGEKQEQYCDISGCYLISSYHLLIHRVSQQIYIPVILLEHLIS